jgi:hypothetical protein
LDLDFESKASSLHVAAIILRARDGIDESRLPKLSSFSNHPKMILYDAETNPDAMHVRCAKRPDRRISRKGTERHGDRV